MGNKTKKEMENELRRLLIALMNGAREEFKKAKKEIETLWRHETETFKSSAHVALEFLPKFNQIEKIANKEAFASGLSFFFLTLADDHFETLKNFTLNVIQHPDGHVREAARKTGDWLYISLTSRAEPFVYPEGKPLSEKQKNDQIIARKQYLDLVAELETLIDHYDDGSDQSEYINEMKPSVNKSLQMVWSRLTDSPVYRRITEQVRPIPFEIFMKRKEIENRLAEMLKEAKSDFELDDIKEIIYNEDGQDSLTDIIAMFDTGQGVAKLQNALELINDAWNYFPHKVIGGLSPAEKLLEYSQRYK